MYATKMDLSSLREALSKIDIEGDYVGEQCMKIIIQMSDAAEIGLNTLTYKPPDSDILTSLSERLLEFFPDLNITITDTTLLIDWS